MLATNSNFLTILCKQYSAPLWAESGPPVASISFLSGRLSGNATCHEAEQSIWSQGVGLDGCSKRKRCALAGKHRRGGSDDFSSMEKCVSLAHHGSEIAQYCIYSPI